MSDPEIEQEEVRQGDGDDPAQQGDDDEQGKDEGDAPDHGSDGGAV